MLTAFRAFLSRNRGYAWTGAAIGLTHFTFASRSSLDLPEAWLSIALLTSLMALLAAGLGEFVARRRAAQKSRRLPPPASNYPDQRH